MCELINVTQQKKGGREFVQTLGGNFSPESAEQRVIVKIHRKKSCKRENETKNVEEKGN
jgi:hypothetical protein